MGLNCTKNGKGNKISDLNSLQDECLEHIFSFLPILDVVRSERVCKKWKRIISSMTFNHQIVVDSDHVCHLEKILNKYGPNIISLYIFPDYYYQQDNAFAMINENCKKLMYLRVCSSIFYMEHLKFDSYSFLKNLKCLSIEYLGVTFFGNILDNVFTLLENTNLEKFIFYDLFEHYKISIEDLGKKIHINKFGINENLNLRRLFRRFPEVTELKISDVPEFMLHKDLILISYKIISLELTDLSHDFLKENRYKKLQFNNLRRLHFENCTHVNDDVIFTFVEKCPLLEHIHLSYCKNISDNGYRHLENLKALTTLHVESDKVTGETLKLITQSCKNLRETSPGLNDVVKDR